MDMKELEKISSVRFIVGAFFSIIASIFGIFYALIDWGIDILKAKQREKREEAKWQEFLGPKAEAAALTTFPSAEAWTYGAIDRMNVGDEPLTNEVYGAFFRIFNNLYEQEFSKPRPAEALTGFDEVLDGSHHDLKAFMPKAAYDREGKPSVVLADLLDRKPLERWVSHFYGHIT